MTIKSAGLRAVAGETDTPDVRIADSAAGVRQVDFQNLHWSVPGGVGIQFGVMGVARGGSQVWFNQAAHVGGAHKLNVFDDKGKLEGPFSPDGGPVDSGTGFYVQVWGHKMAPVAVRSAAATIEVVLRSDASFDAAHADQKTLRFGPKGALPVASRMEQVGGHAALVVEFRRAEAGLQGFNGSACLTGREHGGVPFEGCDLLGSGKSDRR
jgi:hypothetical protein